MPHSERCGHRGIQFERLIWRSAIYLKRRHSDWGGGIIRVLLQQRWVVVESWERQQSDLKPLEKTVAQATTHWSAQLRHLCTQAFACEADALAALQQFEQELPWHQLDGIRVKQKCHYEKSGKPKSGTPPSRITYHPQASLTLNSTKVKTQQQRAGRFILATNDS